MSAPAAKNHVESAFGGTGRHRSQVPTAVGGTSGMTPEGIQQARWQEEIDNRNRPLSDEELDAMFPPEGYRILKPPDSYVPIRTPARKLMATPTPSVGATPQRTARRGAPHGRDDGGLDERTAGGSERIPGDQTNGL